MNRALPKVSVITITYGHEKYITETLDGVLMQQYDGPVEFIIANDNSPDATDEVVKKYFLENPAPSNFEIKYTKHETNKGMMPNFIWALEQATGKYIALCEGDDYWTESLKLQKQVDFLEENEEFSMVFHAATVKSDINGHNPYVNYSKYLEERVYSGTEILNNFLVPTASTVFRQCFVNNTLLKRLHNPLYIFGDIIVFLHMVEHGLVFGITKAMSVYRINSNSVLNTRREDKFIINHNFIKHHLEMSKDFGGKYYFLNFAFISNSYLEALKLESSINRKIYYLYKYNKNLYKSSKQDCISINNVKVNLSLIFNFFK